MEISDASNQIRNVHTALVFAALISLFTATLEPQNIWTQARSEFDQLKTLFDAKNWNRNLYSDAVHRYAKKNQDKFFTTFPKCIKVNLKTSLQFAEGVSLTEFYLLPQKFNTIEAGVSLFPLFVDVPEGVNFEFSTLGPEALLVSNIQVNTNAMSLGDLKDFWNVLTRDYQIQNFFDPHWTVNEIEIEITPFPGNVSYHPLQEIYSRATVKGAMTTIPDNSSACASLLAQLAESEQQRAQIIDGFDRNWFVPHLGSRLNRTITRDIVEEDFMAAGYLGVGITAEERIASIDERLNEIKSYYDVPFDKKGDYQGLSWSMLGDDPLVEGGVVQVKLFLPLFTYGERIDLRPELEEMFNSHLYKFGTFEQAFSALDRVSVGLDSLALTELERWLDEQFLENQGNTKIFGISAPIHSISVWGAALIAAAAVYLALLYYSIVTHFKYEGEWLSWMGLRRGLPSAIATILTVTVLPLGSLITLIAVTDQTSWLLVMQYGALAITVVSGGATLFLRYLFIANRTIKTSFSAERFEEQD